MKPTNEIRRLQKKLELFDKECFSQILMDLMDDVTMDAELGVYGTLKREKFIKGLKSKYQNQLDELIEKQSKFKQAKLGL